MVKQQQSEAHVTLDGQELRALVGAALSWLRQHQAMINALNVFPVPDGDTGTNMVLTMISAWNEIENLRDDNIGEIAGKVAHGALMGARGNSGVILSQIWRGFARSLDHKSCMDAADLVDAMRQAAETAYKGVVKPVEGTVLTVIREVADETQEIAQETTDLRVLLERMLQRAKSAEERTPALLPVLRQAGVVDAGGQGLVVILEGMWRHTQGLPVEEHGRLTQVVDLAPEAAHPHAGIEELQFDSAYPYDVQFIISGHDLDVNDIRATIESLGDCPLVVGDPRTIKIHVHVADPGIPISYGAQCGSLRDVVVEDMQAQYQEFISGRDEHPVIGPGAEPPAVLIEREEQCIGIVAVVAGEGLGEVFRSLGATKLIQGGQTMNPSTADILQALEQLPTDKAIVLPNNKNIVMAAEQAAEMSDKQVAVVPTRSLPQGIGALLALNQQATLDGNTAAMLRAAKEVTTGEVTRAVRNAQINGVDVQEGAAIGLLNGALVTAGDSFEDVAQELLAQADLEDKELVTIYHGAGVTEERAVALSETLAQVYLDLEFEVLYGGQPHYPYLLSLE
ncbi:MAG: DAK2 domain-containing protein [Chloroflexota bacterium]|nr:DAK2 domain-containing protein [Chloroflexota bacterium]